MALGLAEALKRLDEMEGLALVGAGAPEGMANLVEHLGFDASELASVANAVVKEMAEAATVMNGGATDFGFACFVQGLLLATYRERYGDAE